jgi:RNA polymerase sporulation-specific sigma factor
MATPEKYIQPESLKVSVVPTRPYEVQETQPAAEVIALYPEHATSAIQYSEAKPEKAVPASVEAEWLRDYQVVVAARNDSQLFESLVDEYTGFIKHLTKKYFLAGGEPDDIFQEALFGFYKAVRDYDGMRSSFRSFAALCVDRQAITAIKTAARLKHAPLNNYVSFSHSPSGEDDDINIGDSFASQAPSVEETVEGTESLNDLLFMLGSSLSKLESDTLRLFLNGGSYEDMAAELGVSTKTLDNAIQRVKRKILEHGKEKHEVEAVACQREEPAEDEILQLLDATIDPLKIAAEALAKLKAAGHSGIILASDIPRISRMMEPIAAGITAR